MKAVRYNSSGDLMFSSLPSHTSLPSLPSFPYTSAMRYVLVGNYGTGNFGDEALKEYFLRAFPDMEWRVLSAHPQLSEYPRLPGGLRSLLLTPWWRTLGVLHSCNGVVFGGGTLFTDTESVCACLLWWWHAFVSWLFRKKIILAFQGIGPFRTRVGEWCARWVVIHAAFVSVRDAASARRVAAWGLNKNIVLTFDPIFSLFKEKKQNTGSQKLLVIIPRKNSPAAFIGRAVELSKRSVWGEIQILSLAPGNREEQAVCRALAHALAVPSESIVPIWSADVLAALVSGATFVFSQRYHGALAALALGIPFEVMSQREGEASMLSSVSVPAALDLLRDGEQALRRVLLTDKSGSATIQ